MSNAIIIQAMTLKPGDKVLLATNAGDCGELREMFQVLKTRFSDVDFTLVTETTGIFKHEGDLIELSTDDYTELTDYTDPDD